MMVVEKDKPYLHGLVQFPFKAINASGYPNILWR